MSKNEISQYVLRTTDVPAATAFYDAVLGRHGDAVFPLHEQARARGARPHWLGLIDTADPEAAATPFLSSGAMRLGPRPGGGFVIRDPGGAVIALGPTASPSTAGVVWHVLRSQSPERAIELYTQAFGWSVGDPVDGFRPLAWRRGTERVGVIGDAPAAAGVHPHWLYFFEVPSLDQGVAEAKTRGASMLPNGALPDGRRFALGDDPQGAAFGLMERAP